MVTAAETELPPKSAPRLSTVTDYARCIVLLYFSRASSTAKHCRRGDSDALQGREDGEGHGVRHRLPGHLPTVSGSLQSQLCSIKCGKTKINCDCAQQKLDWLTFFRIAIMMFWVMKWVTWWAASTIGNSPGLHCWRRTRRITESGWTAQRGWLTIPLWREFISTLLYLSKTSCMLCGLSHKWEVTN